MPFSHCHFATGRRAQHRLAHALAARLAGDRFLAALDHLGALLAKAGFNPDQPRVPPGNPDGGRWRYVEGYAQGEQPWDGSNRGPPLEEPPESPKETPKDRATRLKAAKDLAKWLALNALRRAGPIGAVITAIDVGRRLYKEYPSIQSYQDQPKTLKELQESVGKRRPGYEDHHIVERGAGRHEEFTPSMINGVDNMVSVPKYKHHQITGWYNTPNKDFGMLKPRDYLRGKEWSEHVRIGHEAMRLFGVLK